MLNAVLRRHDLLFLTAKGWRLAWENRISPRTEDDRIWSKFSQIPAICRSQTGGAAPGWVDVGFSFPVRLNGARRRIASSIPFCEIERRISSEEAAAYELKGLVGTLVYNLCGRARAWEISAGIFGAAALQAVTGLPYLHDASDLDVVLYPCSSHGLREFSVDIRRLEKQWGIRVDVELWIGEERYLKLWELLSGQNTVLVKNGNGEPELLSCHDVWELLESNCHRNTTALKRSICNGN